MGFGKCGYPGRPHEGPKVFGLGGSYWMITDEWRGQAVYRSDDGAGSWTRQDHLGGLLLTPRALLVYFTHPYWGGEDFDTMAPDPRTRPSHVRAAVLEVRDGRPVCVEH